MQADEHRSQDQRYHHHPGQFQTVFLEEVSVGCALGQIDDAAQVTEQRHFDQCAEQADDQQSGKTRPDLFEVIGIEGQNAVRGGGCRRVAEDVDQFFKTAIKHRLFTRERALLQRFERCRQHRQRLGHPCPA
ncbi:hypothetical protein D3C84_1030110 [compost metagenome]